MNKWYFNKSNYLYTLPSGCCTIRELLGYKDDNNVYHYAIVQYKDNQYSLVVEWSELTISPIA